MSAVWFALGLSILGIVFVWVMPKRLRSQEIYATWIAVSLLAFLFDGYLGAALNLYYLFRPDPQVIDILFQAVIPGAFGVIVANFMPKEITKVMVYALIWTLISVGIEWLAVQFHYLTYRRWSRLYSIPFYFVGCLFLRWHMHFLRRGNP